MNSARMMPATSTSFSGETGSGGYLQYTYMRNNIMFLSTRILSFYLPTFTRETREEVHLTWGNVRPARRIVWRGGGWGGGEKSRRTANKLHVQ